MHEELRKIVKHGWRQINDGLEEAHQVFEKAIIKASGVEGVCTQDAEGLLEELRIWHLMGLQTDPPQKSPPADGLLLRTCLMMGKQEWIDILRENQQAIEQVVMDPIYSSVAQFAKKHDDAQDNETMLKLFVCAIGMYRKHPKKIHDMHPSILYDKINHFWNSGEQSQEWFDALEENISEIEALGKSTSVFGPSIKPLDILLRKRALEKVAGTPRPNRHKPYF